MPSSSGQFFDSVGTVDILRLGVDQCLNFRVIGVHDAPADRFLLLEDVIVNNVFAFAFVAEPLTFHVDVHGLAAAVVERQGIVWALAFNGVAADVAHHGVAHGNSAGFKGHQESVAGVGACGKGDTVYKFRGIFFDQITVVDKSAAGR